MNGLLVIVPSRGRPQNVARLYEAWDETGAEAHLIVAADRDDPELGGYRPGQHCLMVQDRMGMVGTLNEVATTLAGQYPYLSFMGDDHVPRTAGWDKQVVDALDQLGTGIVYGNDLFQAGSLPTAVFLTSDIVRTLGYMVPPCLKHMFADNFWRDLGRGAGCLQYLPDVIVEHVHPQAGGKAPMDDRYAEVWPLMAADQATYQQYVDSGLLAADIAKVRALR